MTGDLTKVGTWCPFAIHSPITTGEFWPESDPKVAVCEHITAGNDSRNHLQNVKNQSSTHFLIGIYSGVPELHQFMPLEFRAWGNGIVGHLTNTDMPAWLHERIVAKRNPNDYTISVEHESPYPMPHPFDARILDLSEKLNRWIKSVMLSVIHVIGHFMVDDINRPFCPGGPHGVLFPFARMQAAIGANPPPLPAPPPVNNRTAIERYYDENGAFAEFGFPMEVDAAGRIKERTRVLPDVIGDPFQIGFYQKGLIVWRRDLGTSRYNSGAWLLDELASHGEL